MILLKKIKYYLNLYMRRFISVIYWLLIPEKINEINKKKLLLIYDFVNQPFSIGDILIAQEAGLVMKFKYNLEVIDFAIFIDFRNPKHADSAFSNINSDNVFSCLSNIIQAVQVNEDIGSVLLFSDRNQLDDYIQLNRNKYVIWPDLIQYISREYIYYTLFNNLLYEYYKENKSIPTLHCRKSAQQWADNFIKQHADTKKVVTVQLRKNIKTPDRNTSDESWLKLFEYCQNENHPVLFIIICARDEINNDIRKHKNVIIAKDYFTNLEQDLALVEKSHMHMGASSGPSTMAFFSDKPYCIFKWDGINYIYKDLKKSDDKYYFYFSNEYQRLIKEGETADLLIREFNELWNHIK